MDTFGCCTARARFPNPLRARATSRPRAARVTTCAGGSGREWNRSHACGVDPNLPITPNALSTSHNNSSPSLSPPCVQGRSPNPRRFLHLRHAREPPHVLVYKVSCVSSSKKILSSQIDGDFLCSKHVTDVNPQRAPHPQTNVSGDQTSCTRHGPIGRSPRRSSCSAQGSFFFDGRVRVRSGELRSSRGESGGAWVRCGGGSRRSR